MAASTISMACVLYYQTVIIIYLFSKRNFLKAVFIASTFSFTTPYFSARFNRFSNSSLDKESKLLLFLTGAFLGLASCFFPSFVFFRLPFFPSSFLLFPLSRLSESFLSPFGPFAVVVVVAVIPNLAARAFFLSSKDMPLVWTALAGAAGVSASFVSLTSLGFSSTTGSSGFFSGSGVGAFGAFGAATGAAATGAGAASVTAGAAAAAGGAVAVGASARPNSSSSSRTCNLLTSSALSPSVDKPRLASSARSSDTAIISE
mmetsp:Transcript_17001/g.35095  ORF Transcript_17001/g.35095 Transcript_17001/m.35095 type:complete len:260 (-) Transcript_17001:603-1382(-)